MDVVYVSDEETRGVVENPEFLLAEKGSHMFFGALKNTSRYNGVSFLDLRSYELTRSIADLRPRNAPERLVVARDAVMREGPDLVERFFMHDRIACYSLSGTGVVDVLFDVREAYDGALFGREHHVEELEGHGVRIFRVSARGRSVAVLVEGACERADEWQAMPTPFDAQRGDGDEWWVWRGLVLRPQGSARIVICPAERLQEAQQVFHAPVWDAEPESLGSDPVLSLCVESLDGLVARTPTDQPAVLAGLPWFFQVYTRDEAVSVGALLALGRYLAAGRILVREIGRVLDHGHVPNRYPHSMTGSADGGGWAFFRLSQLHKLAPHALSDDQWRFVYQQLCSSLDRLEFRDGLVQNGPQETWMDTTGGTGDDRRGARIEIQALALRMLSFAALLGDGLGDSRSADWASRERALSGRVRAEFLSGGVLGDGAGDATVRPNALLARYIYPDILDDEEWRVFTRRALSALMLPWGGLSSIDQGHRLFVPRHSGADDRSYHRGDSWYFVNNLVGCSLVDLGEEFVPHARAIFEGSSHDLLWQGAMGHCSEISSASMQEPFGCRAQAWSASSLIELAFALGRLPAASSRPS